MTCDEERKLRKTNGCSSRRLYGPIPYALALPRSGPNRSEWHYINLPIFLTDAARAEFSGRLTASVTIDPPAGATTDTPGMNVVQAIRFTRGQLADKQSAPDS